MNEQSMVLQSSGSSGKGVGWSLPVSTGDERFIDRKMEFILFDTVHKIHVKPDQHQFSANLSAKRLPSKPGATGTTKIAKISTGYVPEGGNSNVIASLKTDGLGILRVSEAPKAEVTAREEDGKDATCTRKVNKASLRADGFGVPRESEAPKEEVTAEKDDGRDVKCTLKVDKMHIETKQIQASSNLHDDTHLKSESVYMVDCPVQSKPESISPAGDRKSIMSAQVTPECGQTETKLHLSSARKSLDSPGSSIQVNSETPEVTMTKDVLGTTCTLTGEAGDEIFIDHRMEFIASLPPKKIRVTPGQHQSSSNLSAERLPSKLEAIDTTKRAKLSTGYVPGKGNSDYASENGNAASFDLVTPECGQTETKLHLSSARKSLDSPGSSIQVNSKTPEVTMTKDVLGTTCTLTGEAGDEIFIDHRMEFIASLPPKKIRVTPGQHQSSSNLSAERLSSKLEAIDTTKRAKLSTGYVPGKGNSDYASENGNAASFDLADGGRISRASGAPKAEVTTEKDDGREATCTRKVYKASLKADGFGMPGESEAPKAEVTAEKADGREATCTRKVYEMHIETKQIQASSDLHDDTRLKSESTYMVDCSVQPKFETVSPVDDRNSVTPVQCPEKTSSTGRTFQVSDVKMFLNTDGTSKREHSESEFQTDSKTEKEGFTRKTIHPGTVGHLPAQPSPTGRTFQVSDIQMFLNTDGTSNKRHSESDCKTDSKTEKEEATNEVIYPGNVDHCPEEPSPTGRTFQVSDVKMFLKTDGTSKRGHSESEFQTDSKTEKGGPTREIIYHGNVDHKTTESIQDKRQLKPKGSGGGYVKSAQRVTKSVVPKVVQPVGKSVPEAKVPVPVSIIKPSLESNKTQLSPDSPVSPTFKSESTDATTKLGGVARPVQTKVPVQSSRPERKFNVSNIATFLNTDGSSRKRNSENKSQVGHKTGVEIPPKSLESKRQSPPQSPKVSDHTEKSTIRRLTESVPTKAKSPTMDEQETKVKYRVRLDKKTTEHPAKDKNQNTITSSSKENVQRQLSTIGNETFTDHRAEFISKEPGMKKPTESIQSKRQFNPSTSKRSSTGYVNSAQRVTMSVVPKAEQPTGKSESETMVQYPVKNIKHGLKSNQTQMSPELSASQPFKFGTADATATLEYVARPTQKKPGLESSQSQPQDLPGSPPFKSETTTSTDGSHQMNVERSIQIKAPVQSSQPEKKFNVSNIATFLNTDGSATKRNSENESQTGHKIGMEMSSKSMETKRQHPPQSRQVSVHTEERNVTRLTEDAPAEIKLSSMDESETARLNEKRNEQPANDKNENVVTSSSKEHVKGYLSADIGNETFIDHRTEFISKEPCKKVVKPTLRSHEEKKVNVQKEANTSTSDSLLDEAIRSVTELDPPVTVDRTEHMTTIAEDKKSCKQTAV